MYLWLQLILSTEFRLKEKSLNSNWLNKVLLLCYHKTALTCISENADNLGFVSETTKEKKALFLASVSLFWIYHPGKDGM